MSKKFSKSRVIIFSIILLILIGFAFIQNKNLITAQIVNNPLFLQYKGDIYIDKSEPPVKRAVCSSPRRARCWPCLKAH